MAHTPEKWWILYSIGPGKNGEELRCRNHPLGQLDLIHQGSGHAAAAKFCFVSRIGACQWSESDIKWSKL